MYEENPQDVGNRALFGTPGFISAFVIIGFMLYFFSGN